MPNSFNIIHAVRRGLDDLQVDAAESNVVWTQAIKTELCRIGRREFRCKVGAHSREVAKCDRDYGEWLYDVTWLEYDGDGCVTVAHLIAECEWGGRTDVDEDFQKLLLARATMRLMIFDGNYEPGSLKIADHLACQVRRFNHSCDEDAWLLAAWERTSENERGWSFRYFAIDRGAAREFERRPDAPE